MITEKKLVALAQRAAEKIDRYCATRAPKTIKQFKADVANIIAAELRKTFLQ